jgi:UPF0271 protein
VRAISSDLAILAISGTVLEQVARAAAVPVFSEIFADRAYQSNGQLVPRTHPDAVIHDAEAAVARLLGFVQSGRMPVLDGDPIPLAAQSICVHGDNPGAVQMAQLIRKRLTAAGIHIAPFVP